jgi:hypothetical protein
MGRYYFLEGVKDDLLLKEHAKIIIGRNIRSI